MTSTSDVYIEGTQDDPHRQAQIRLSKRNDQLLAKASSKAALLTELRLEPRDRQAAQAELAGFYADELLPYLDATDQALYAPAAGAAPTRLLVRALRIQHGIIAGSVVALDTASSADKARAAARSVVTTLAACLEIQNAVLVPALAELPGADLTLLAEDLETMLSGAQLEKPDEIDVRRIPHGERHPRIFGSYARLAPGESFVLVNNHDPKPLRREFDAAFPDQFEWNYLEAGPKRWRVRIGRLSTHTARCRTTGTRNP